MKSKVLIAACAAACCAFPALAQMDAMKGKMKEGNYEVKMEMEMPGMPQGMGKQAMTFQNCVSNKDIEAGQVGKADPKMAKDCEMKDFKMSGNTASYKMVCKGANPMTADTTINFRNDGYTMVMNTAMQGMTMKQTMDARYLGPCKK